MYSQLRTYFSIFFLVRFILAQHQNRINSKIFRIALTASLSGFLFGFDTVVIRGANLPIKDLWQTSPWFHGTITLSLALWVSVARSLLGRYTL